MAWLGLAFKNTEVKEAEIHQTFRIWHCNWKELG